MEQFKRLLEGRIKPQVELRIEQGSVLDMIFVKTGRTDELGFSSRLWFGRYKGALVMTILESDPRYLEWAINEGVIRVDNEVADALEEALLNTYQSMYDGPFYWL